MDKFDEDDDNDGILDENDMDDDNDGIDDDSDRCPGTPAGERVDVDGCSSSQILKEVTEDGNLPGFNFVFALSSILLIAYSRKIKIKFMTQLDHSRLSDLSIKSGRSRPFRA